MTDQLAPAIRKLIDETPKGVPEHLTQAQQREYMQLLSDLLFLRYGEPGPQVHAVDDHRVPVEGGTVLVRTYRPSADHALPVHVTLHGGGWKLGSVADRVSDAICRQRCQDAQCVVAAVEYRLAPEHRFPVPLLDAYAALKWVADNADLLDIDPENISIGGNSAGANLAAAVALVCRDRGGPHLVLQLLEVPPVDLTRETARATLAAGVIPDVPQPTMDDAAAVYLNSPDEALNPLASPLFASNLVGLAPAHIMTAEFDMLRTEGELYAKRLREAGVPCTDRRFPGALHGTSMLTRTWEGARTWQQDASEALRRAHRTGLVADEASSQAS